MLLSKKDQRLLMLYDFKSGLNPKNSHSKLKNAFPNCDVSYSTVAYWFRRFQNNDESLEDCERSGRPTTSSGLENIEAVRDIVDLNPRVSYKAISEALSIGNSTVQTILHEHLNMRKMSCRFVPHQLTNVQKQNRRDICKQWLDTFHNDSSTALSGLVTGDETILKQYESHDKASSAVWCYENEVPVPQVSNSKWTKRVMVCTFFMRSGHLISIPVEQNKTVTANWYATVALPQMVQAFDAKRRNRTHFRLHHDNAPAHSAKQTQDYLSQNNIRVLPHPPYSPDLAPADFFLFGMVKQKLRGREFQSLQALLDAYNEILSDIPKSMWRDCFKDWFRRMNLCIESNGDYFE